MIQRIQSVWLLLGSIAIFLTLRLSFYSGLLISKNEYHSILPNDNLFMLILTCGLGTLLLVNIFLFKNRTLQFRICIISLIVEALILLLTFKQIEKFSKGSFDIWSLLHIVVIFSIIKATISIYKDEKLIKDSNRLR